MSLHDLSALPDPGQNLLDLLKAACDRLELEYAAYAGVNPIDESMHAIVNYPERWKKHYQNHALHETDPTLIYSRRSQGPVHWDRLTDDPHYNSVFAHARDFGIPETGVTIPVHGAFGEKGMLSVTRKMTLGHWQKHLAHILPELQTEAALIHDAVMQQGTTMRAINTPSLSVREVEILQWSAAGKTQHDIADILSISARTVEVHMRSARQKLGALTTAQAVARAVGMGMIYPM